jgi:hypothetical protein
MLQKFIPHINDYFKQLSKIEKEKARKEYFVVLMTQLFGNESENLKAIQRFATGAEKTIRNISPAHGIKTEVTDTQHNNVIIEFERDLKIKDDAVHYQLAEYFSSNFGSYNYILSARDCINWESMNLNTIPKMRHTKN